MSVSAHVKFSVVLILVAALAACEDSPTNSPYETPDGAVADAAPTPDTLAPDTLSPDTLQPDALQPDAPLPTCKDSRKQDLQSFNEATTDSLLSSAT